MYRTITDDFDGDDGAKASLQLESEASPAPSAAHGAASGYDSGGVDFDDDNAAASLELDLPLSEIAASQAPAPLDSPFRATETSVSASMVPQSGREIVNPPTRSTRHPASPSAPPHKGNSVGPRGAGPAHADGASGHEIELPAEEPTIARPSLPGAGAALLARYPALPTTVFGAPTYSVGVLMRQFELRSDLASLRRRRSPDVPLFEQALLAYEPRTFRLGLAITVAALAVGLFIFFLPVTLRFMRD